MYHASECGHLDIVNDLHRTGVALSLHSWASCIEYAFDFNNDATLTSLINSFHDVYSDDDVTREFAQQVVPLLFDILKVTKVTRNTDVVDTHPCCSCVNVVLSFLVG